MKTVEEEMKEEIDYRKKIGGSLTPSQIDEISTRFLLKRRGSQNHEKGNQGNNSQKKAQRGRQQKPHENYGTNLRQQYEQLAQLNQGISQLLRIVEVLPNESTSYPDDLPTSFVAVEMAIAKHIYECLQDVPKRKRDISLLLTFLRLYKVVRFVPGKNPTVSLQQVHLILQDNYKGSSLCSLFNIFLAGFMVTTTKVITF
ncbi:hypothetical protein [Pedobacter sp. MW01-1-1]|uniref:hypothetical protein n=1 Tax=Pedobacter sp. MW01-1-1 TaxID=3383027 RepID=UPI003FF0CEC2